MPKLSKRGAMLRDLVNVLNFNGEEVRELSGDWARIAMKFDSDGGPHEVHVASIGEGTIVLHFVVDPDTARKLILAYDRRDNPDCAAA